MQLLMVSLLCLFREQMRPIFISPLGHFNGYTPMAEGPSTHGEWLEECIPELASESEDDDLYGEIDAGDDDDTTDDEEDSGGADGAGGAEAAAEKNKWIG